MLTSIDKHTSHKLSINTIHGQKSRFWGSQMNICIEKL